MQITDKTRQQLHVDLDGESLNIYWDKEDGSEFIPICYWHIEEVREDPEVAISMCSALYLFYENRKELLEKLGYKVVGNSKKK